jgi:hypothetical protein
MKPVHQTKFGETGNCLQACVASLLEVDLSEVPEFSVVSQFMLFMRFMRTHGMQPVAYQIDNFHYPYNAYYLLWGKSPRGINHSVVAYNGEIVHDPHPDSDGLDKIEMGVVFITTFTKV